MRKLKAIKNDKKYIFEWQKNEKKQLYKLLLIKRYYQSLKNKDLNKTLYFIDLLYNYFYVN